MIRAATMRAAMMRSRTELGGCMRRDRLSLLWIDVLPVQVRGPARPLPCLLICLHPARKRKNHRSKVNADARAASTVIRCPRTWTIKFQRPPRAKCRSSGRAGAPGPVKGETHSCNPCRILSAIKNMTVAKARLQRKHKKKD